MATNQQKNRENFKPETYNYNEDFRKNWANRLNAAMLMNNATPQTMGGYLLGSIVKKPFQEWISQLWGVPKDDIPTITKPSDGFDWKEKLGNEFNLNL